MQKVKGYKIMTNDEWNKQVLESARRTEKEIEELEKTQDGSHANKNLKAVFVGGRFDGYVMSHDLLEKIGNGKFTLRFSALSQHNPLTENLDLEDQPLVNGYLSPMLDGGMLRYETQEVYDRYFD